MINCKQCGKETTNPKFCCQSCSATFNNKGVRRHGSGGRKCLTCENVTHNPKYCSNVCQKSYEKKILYESIENDTIVRWNLIRKFLLEKDGRCSICGISEWQEKPISLECDHIDGDGTNNRLSNARLLCPNCHSQTHTFRAKNVNNPNGKEFRRKRYYKNVKNTGV